MCTKTISQDLHQCVCRIGQALMRVDAVSTSESCTPDVTTQKKRNVNPTKCLECKMNVSIVCRTKCAHDGMRYDVVLVIVVRICVALRQYASPNINM